MCGQNICLALNISTHHLIYHKINDLNIKQKYYKIDYSGINPLNSWDSQGVNGMNLLH